MNRPTARWLRQLAGGAAVAVGLRGAAANAQCAPYSNVAVGIHLGIAFGGPGWPVKVNYGVTGRFGRDTAMFTRLEGFGGTALQLTIGATRMFTDSTFLEGGATGVLGFDGAAAGVHVGGGPASRAAGILIGGTLPLIGDRSFKYFQSAAFLYPREICFNPGSGRALRFGESVALPPVLARLDCAEDHVLASAWLDDARAELASVPAFLRLAAELTTVGAPTALRHAALAAADDERQHAEAAFGMASRWAGSPFVVAPLDAQPRFDCPSPAAFTQLATEAWQDGCLGEGTAALCARRGLMRVRDEEARRTLARIAPDEERHAELSWSILEWCSCAGGEAVREAIAQLSRRATPALKHAEEDADWLSWNGRLTAAERSSARAHIEDQASARLARAVQRVGFRTS